MRTTFESDQAIVIDDFLPSKVLDNLREQVECLKLKQLEYGDDKIYKLDCGTIYKSDKKWMNDSDTRPPAIKEFMDKVAVTHPLGIRASSNEEQVLMKNFSCMVHAYGAGSELSWHRDAGNFTGAYTFYLHRHWMHTWGGNMLIADDKTNFEVYNDAPENIQPSDMYAKEFNKILPTFNLGFESKCVLDPGVGMYIAPKPNRIVFVKKNTVHKVERIDKTAGGNWRLSLTGFFE